MEHLLTYAQPEHPELHHNHHQQHHHHYHHHHQAQPQWDQSLPVNYIGANNNSDDGGFAGNGILASSNSNSSSSSNNNIHQLGVPSHEEYVLTSEFYRESREPNITYAYEIRPYWDASMDYGYNGVGYEEYNQLGKGILQTAEQLQIRGLSDYHDMAEFSSSETHLDVNNSHHHHHVAATPVSGSNDKPMPHLYQRPQLQQPNPIHPQPQRSTTATTPATFGKQSSSSKSACGSSAVDNLPSSSVSSSVVTPLTTKRSRAKRPRLSEPNPQHSDSENPAGNTVVVVAPMSSSTAGVQSVDKWTFADQLQSDKTNGRGAVQGNDSKSTVGADGAVIDNVYIRTITTRGCNSIGSYDGDDGRRGDDGGSVGNVVVLGDGKDDDDGTSVGSTNAHLMGVSMGFLDFAAEPAAPTATPVMDEQHQQQPQRQQQHTDDGCDDTEMGTNIAGPSQTDDGSDVDDDDDDRNNVQTLNEHKTVSMQFQTLHPMDQQQKHDNSAEKPKTTRAKQQHSTPLAYQQAQNHHQHKTDTANALVETIVISSDPREHKLHHHHQQIMDNSATMHHRLHVTEMLDDNTAQEITIEPDDDGMMIAMDPNEIKSETPQEQLHQQVHMQRQQHEQQLQQQHDSNVHEVSTADGTHQSVDSGHMVTMMMSSGHLVELYQSDTSDDSKMTDLHDISSTGCENSGNLAVAADDDTTTNQMHFHSHIPTSSTPHKRSAADAHSESNQSDASPLVVTSGPKTWTQANMDAALGALRAQSMSLTKASVTFGIPSTTLWQRAHRLGIDTPKKEGPSKTWSDDSLNNALEALRNGEISANKASKAYGIPSSTLYKIARREGIRLAAPFNAAPTNWSVEDLERALESIRSGATSVQKASLVFGIPTGTLYGRCKREGIELSRSNPTPWSEENMTEALESVRIGMMSINQAAINFNLPYSSLYGRFKRGKFDAALDGSYHEDHQIDQSSENSYELTAAYQPPQQQQQHQLHSQQHQVLQSDPSQVVYLKEEQS